MSFSRRSNAAVWIVFACGNACTSAVSTGNAQGDAGADAGGAVDAGAATNDAGLNPDAGTDAGAGADAGADSGADAGTGADAGADAGAGGDAGAASPDAGTMDAGASVDAGGVADAGPKSWRTAQLLETGVGTAVYPHVGTDSAGNAIAVWRQNDGVVDSIFANRYVASMGTWGSAVSVEVDPNVATDPRVGVAPNGDAVAVWQQYDGTLYNIWANRFVVADNRWGDAGRIEFGGGGWASASQVAIDLAGNAIAVWQRFDLTRTNIWANRFDADAGRWGDAGLIETDSSGNASAPKVAIDSLGNAVAVWQQFDGVRDSIWANRYVATAGKWGDAGVIESDSDGGATDVSVGVDSSGNAIAVWRQSPGGVIYFIKAARFDADAGTWGAERRLSVFDAGQGLQPSVAVDPAGNAMVVWRQWDPDAENIWFCRFASGTLTWSDAGLVETNDAGAAYAPKVAVDAWGNAVAVWYQNTGSRSDIWSNRFWVSTGLWDDAGVIEIDNAGSASAPEIAIDSMGNAVVVWHQDDGGAAPKTSISANWMR